MRTKVLGILVFAAFLGGFAACKGDAKQPAAEQKVVQDQYKCPMNCSDQLYDKPGNCPNCGMELEKVNPS